MYEELLSTLREYTVFLTREAAERADENIYEGPITLPNALRRAADAIKELQKDAYFHKYNSAFWEDRYYSLADDKWIPVTEEPPLKVGDDGYNGYLVYANGYYSIADYTTDKLDFVPYFHVNGEYEPDVTHWMPLPKPPKEE